MTRRRLFAARSISSSRQPAPGRVRNAGRGQPLHTRTVIVNQFTSDCCLWVDNVARADMKKDQHDNRLPHHLPVKQSQAWCRFGTVIGKNMQRSPASGALAAVARAKQGLEPRSVGLDEETFNLDFVIEERLACPTAMRLLTVRKLAGRKQRESI